MTEYIIGIDDAGRGPVLGSMVLAGILIEKEKEPELKELGAKDSKLLTPAKRKKLARYIKKNYSFHMEKSSPKEIDDCENLNNLEAMKAAMIINKLSENIKDDIEVIADCPSINTAEWAAYLKKLVTNQKIKIRAEHKADFNYPSVSAASIIAKELREEEIEDIRKDLGIKFGSGYPSDPQTIDFIKYNYKNPKYKDIIRHSWDTVKRLHEKANQRELV
jgi:ribonuclease HII